MNKKVISIILLSLLVLGGCSNSKTVGSNNSTNNNTKSKSAVNSTQNASAAVGVSKQGESNTQPTGTEGVKAPKLSSSQEAKVKNDVTSVVSSLKSTLNSIEEPEEINIGQ